MTYLHSKTTQEGNQKCDVFHQDLKADNILLYTSGNCEHDQQLRAKIADFGLSVMRKKVSDLKNKKTSIVGGTRTSSKTKSGSNSKAGYYLSFVKHIGGTPAYMVSFSFTLFFPFEPSTSLTLNCRPQSLKHQTNSQKHGKQSMDDNSV